MSTTECRYIPHAEAAAYSAAGWTIKGLGDTHHGRYSAIASRPAVTNELDAIQREADRIRAVTWTHAELTAWIKAETQAIEAAMEDEQWT